MPTKLSTEKVRRVYEFIKENRDQYDVKTMNKFDESRLDLRDQLDALIKFIRDSNPSYERVTG
jgi:hypothetical protein